MTLSRGSVAL